MKIADFGVGYVNIINIGPNPDRLKSATTEISERVEIHSMTLTNAGMQQRLVANGLELGARSVTDLKPGGTHLRFVGSETAAPQGSLVQCPAQLRKGRPRRRAISDNGSRRKVALSGCGKGRQR